MQLNDPSQWDKRLQNVALESTIRIGLILVLVIWCFKICRPFIDPVIWGVIISIAVYPLFRRLAALFGGKTKLAAAAFTVVALGMLVVPTILLFESLVHWGSSLFADLNEGSLDIPPPAENVAEWPLIGQAVYDFWGLAASNLEAALIKIGPQLKPIAKWMLGGITGLGTGVIQFVISILIAGVLLAQAKGGNETANKIFVRLAGEKGKDYAQLAQATVQSVSQGVLGVAIIQALAAGIGFLIAGIPGAGFWTLLVLILAVVQLPPTIIILPIVIYFFSVAGPVGAIVFLIWNLIVSFGDNILKPILMGRGVDVPILVIMIGAIGGMLLSGIIGLFVGSVILALSYKLFQAWLKGGEAEEASGTTESIDQEEPSAEEKVD